MDTAPPAHFQTPGAIDALAVVRRLREAGHLAYFAGGCVRDLLMDIEPKDYDVATDAPPARVRSLFANTQAVGAAFGVILVRQGRSQIEVATFRADGAYQDGRRPTEVRFTTAEEDAQRRDFTLNGLFLDPLKDGPIDAQVIDYVAGRRDLSAGVIRAIGDPEARFEEDHLRLLRAVRFAARLGFSIEPATAVAIRRHAPRLARISPERVGEEVRRMLTPPTRAAAWRLLTELELSPILFRFLQCPASNSANEPKALALFPRLTPGRPVPFGLALAAATLQYIHDAAPAAFDVRTWLEKPSAAKAVQAMRQGLKISNEDSNQMLEILEGLAPLLREESPPVATLKRFLARPTSSLSRDLLAALGENDLITPHRLAHLTNHLAAFEKTDFAPHPFITGDDLLTAGFERGPIFKRVLDAVYDAQLEERVTSREQAMQMAEQRRVGD